jgi:hypothetical protein
MAHNRRDRTTFENRKEAVALDALGEGKFSLSAPVRDSLVAILADEVLEVREFPRPDVARLKSVLDDLARNGPDRRGVLTVIRG